MLEVNTVTISFKTREDTRLQKNSVNSRILYQLLKEVPSGGSLDFNKVLPVKLDNPNGNNQIEVILTNRISNRNRNDNVTPKFEVKGKVIGQGGNGSVEECVASITLDDENNLAIIKERAESSAKLLICKDQLIVSENGATNIPNIEKEWINTDEIYKQLKPLIYDGDRTLSIYMPRFPGKTLYDFIRDGASIDQKYDAISATINALSIIHKKNLVHLDFKPYNIIYCPLTQRAFIIDFGAAREIGDLIPFQGCCTLAYSAPELLADKETFAEFSADIFSLAFVIAEILSPGRFCNRKENIPKDFKFTSDDFSLFPTPLREILVLNLNKMIDPEPKNRPPLEVVAAFFNTLRLLRKIERLEAILSVYANSKPLKLLRLKEKFDLDLKNYNISICEEQIERYHRRYQKALNIIEEIENEAILRENNDVKSIIKDITCQPDYTDFIKFDPIEERYYRQITKLRSNLTDLLYSPDTSDHMRLVIQQLLKAIRNNELNENFEKRFNELLEVCGNVMPKNKPLDGIRIFSPPNEVSSMIKFINEIMQTINLNIVAARDETEEPILNQLEPTHEGPAVRFEIF